MGTTGVPANPFSALSDLESVSIAAKMKPGVVQSASGKTESPGDQKDHVNLKMKAGVTAGKHFFGIQKNSYLESTDSGRNPTVFWWGGEGKRC